MVMTVRNLTSSSATVKYFRYEAGYYIGSDVDAGALRAKREEHREASAWHGCGAEALGLKPGARVDAELGFALAPVVTSVAVEADPDGDGLWSPSESVTVTIAFSDAVTVRTADGTPSVSLLAGGVREAVWSGGSGTAALTFAWEVGATEDAVRSVLVPENALKLNGGAIEGPTGLAAALAHAGAGRAGTPREPRTELGALSVADVSAAEGASLAFAVTLDPAAPDTVRVDWATADGTAKAGEDYEADSGIIENTDLMPQAWLARFGAHGGRAGAGCGGGAHPLDARGRCAGDGGGPAPRRRGARRRGARGGGGGGAARGPLGLARRRDGGAGEPDRVAVGGAAGRG